MLYTQYVLEGTVYKGLPSKSVVFFAPKLSKMYTEKYGTELVKITFVPCNTDCV